MIVICDDGCRKVCVGRWCFFFQAEDGIRDLVRSRGLGDVYKRQGQGADETWVFIFALAAVVVMGAGFAHGIIPPQ